MQLLAQANGTWRLFFFSSFHCSLSEFGPRASFVRCTVECHCLTTLIQDWLLRLFDMDGRGLKCSPLYSAMGQICSWKKKKVGNARGARHWLNLKRHTLTISTLSICICQMSVKAYSIALHRIRLAVAVGKLHLPPQIQGYKRATVKRKKKLDSIYSFLAPRLQLFVKHHVDLTIF